MAEWIEVPAHRILIVSGLEARREFDFLNEDGRPCQEAEMIYRVVKKANQKVYKPARFFLNSYMTQLIFCLEEI